MDTAAGACSGALWSNAAVVERVQPMQRGHAEALMPMLVSIMREAGCAFADLDLIAVTVGPGGVYRPARRPRRGARHRPGGRSTLLRRIHPGGDGGGDRLADAGGSPGSRRARQQARRRLRAGVRGGAGARAARHRDPERLGERLSGRRLAVAGDGAALVTAALRAAGADVELIAGPEYPTASRRGRDRCPPMVSGERTAASPAPIYLRSPATGPQQAKSDREMISAWHRSGVGCRCRSTRGRAPGVLRGSLGGVDHRALSAESTAIRPSRVAEAASSASCCAAWPPKNARCSPVPSSRPAGDAASED